MVEADAAEDGDLVVLVVSVPRALGDVVSGLLFELGVEGIEEREAADAVELRTYVRPDSAPALSAAIESGLATLREGAGAAPWVRIEPASTEWRTRWAEGLAPVALAAGLTVVPDDGHTAPSRDVIVLERQLAFGFGEHPTTRMAAQALADVLARRGGVTVLDVGTGGGLLALVAERLGARRVFGIDVDAAAVDGARRNSVTNGAERCVFAHEPLESVLESFDVVVANIDVRTLRQLAPELVRVAVGGALLLTGFLEEDRDELVGVYASLGFHVARQRMEEGWLLLHLAAP